MQCDIPETDGLVELIELTQEELEEISGAATAGAAKTDSGLYPDIDNNPP